MPEEIVVLTVITVISGTIMLSFIASKFFRYLSEKAGIKKGGSSSLTSSELERMLRKVVDEANAPMLARIEQIENHLAADASPAPAGAEQSRSLLPHENDPIMEELEASRELAHAAKAKSRAV